MEIESRELSLRSNRQFLSHERYSLKVGSSRNLHKGFFELQEDLLYKPDGKVHSYTSLLLTCNATAILAKDISNRWILNREYRHPTKEVILGCPGGRLEEGEDPIEGGKRELFEETGYWSDEVAIIGHCYPLPGLCNQKVYFLFAKNAYKKGEQKLDPFEFIQPELKTEEELQHELRKGSTADGILCAALYYIQLYSTKLY